MSEVAEKILSREELDAILESFEQAGDDAGLPSHPTPRDAGPSWRTGPLGRSLRDFADEQARILSAQYQRPISFSLRSCETRSSSQVSDAMIGFDRPVLIRFAGEGGVGAFLLGRSLLYGWLGMALGEAAGGPPPPIPDRPYSRIEERFLRRAARELASSLAAALGGEALGPIEVGEVLEPEMLADATSPRLAVASFDAVGFGSAGSLRVALPEERFQETSRRETDASSSGSLGAIGQNLLETSIELHAQIGCAELLLSRVRSLKPGDTIELDGVPDDGIIVLADEAPKYRGQRGTVGDRLAVQIKEQL